MNGWDDTEAAIYWHGSAEASDCFAASDELQITGSKVGALHLMADQPVDERHRVALGNVVDRHHRIAAILLDNRVADQKLNAGRILCHESDLRRLGQLGPDRSPVGAQISTSNGTEGCALDSDAVSRSGPALGLAVRAECAPLANLGGVALDGVCQLPVGQRALFGHVLVQGGHAPL